MTPQEKVAEARRWLAKARGNTVPVAIDDPLAARTIEQLCVAVSHLADVLEERCKP